MGFTSTMDQLRVSPACSTEESYILEMALLAGRSSALSTLMSHESSTSWVVS